MPKSTTDLLRGAVLAGLIAGAIASAFHLMLAEPVIDRAIKREAQTKVESSVKLDAPTVSRAVQRKGLVIGLLVYGAIWGALVGLVSLVVERRRQLWDKRVSGRVLAVIVGWTVAWFPFLKYPANPPGVGESATVAYRQLLYVGFLALSASGTAIAFLLRQRLFSGRPRALLGLYAIYAVALYVAMPANPDRVQMPADLVWTFRGISFAGLILFWLALGTSLQWLTRARA